jgi:anti-anti-sigma regulatory factor
MQRYIENVEVAGPEESTAVVTFTGEHDLRTVDDLKALLASLMSTNDVVVADMCDARFVDAAFMEVLLDAAVGARRSGTTFRLRLRPYQPMRRAFESRGLYEELKEVPG